MDYNKINLRELLKSGDVLTIRNYTKRGDGFGVVHDKKKNKFYNIERDDLDFNFVYDKNFSQILSAAEKEAVRYFKFFFSQVPSSHRPVHLYLKRN